MTQVVLTVGEIVMMGELGLLTGGGKPKEREKVPGAREVYHLAPRCLPTFEISNQYFDIECDGFPDLVDDLIEKAVLLDLP
jgi:hypothetical protein